MSKSMSEIIWGDANYDPGLFDGLTNHQNHEPDHSSQSSEDMQEVDPNVFFKPSISEQRDTDMQDTNQTSNGKEGIDKICTDLQNKLKLDPEHLKVAPVTSKCPGAEAMHANVIFANAAFHQIGLGLKPAGPVTHAFDDRFKDFVRTRARMILLNPTLEAYSNNPHRNGALPKTLYYLTLDAIEKQPDNWKDDHLPPSQSQDNADSLEAYRDAVGELLKHQRSNLRMLIYEELLPRSKKMTAAQIQEQVKNNWAMRIRMSYARLVMVHYYIHKAKKTSQWIEIDERLGILQTSSNEFQKTHAQLVLDKDYALFSQKRTFEEILSKDFTVPSIEDVHNAMAVVSSSDH
ncbi:hypothetical protein PCANC_07474 [Puccinia coronata f. sp. avenae]|uniref:Uncharacterized protein n=1 Tax=Puccinia coronata f. sp. avenae TaxID=200324 RepID=A0A2N5VTA8_9BASI|nr:hypothetical protein PCANC_07474 [Puccinia coronata f. sp. avenae]